MFTVRPDLVTYGCWVLVGLVWTVRVIAVAVVGTVGWRGKGESSTPSLISSVNGSLVVRIIMSGRSSSGRAVGKHQFIWTILQNFGDLGLSPFIVVVFEPHCPANRQCQSLMCWRRRSTMLNQSINHCPHFDARTTFYIHNHHRTYASLCGIVQLTQLRLNNCIINCNCVNFFTLIGFTF